MFVDVRNHALIREDCPVNPPNEVKEVLIVYTYWNDVRDYKLYAVASQSEAILFPRKVNVVSITKQTTHLSKKNRSKLDELKTPRASSFFNTVEFVPARSYGHTAHTM